MAMPSKETYQLSSTTIPILSLNCNYYSSQFIYSTVIRYCANLPILERTIKISSDNPYRVKLLASIKAIIDRRATLLDLWYFTCMKLESFDNFLTPQDIIIGYDRSINFVEKLSKFIRDMVISESDTIETDKFIGSVDILINDIPTMILPTNTKIQMMATKVAAYLELSNHLIGYIWDFSTGNLYTITRTNGSKLLQLFDE